jgi:Cu(I)/Ag(I) efflux system membrane fusion protein
MSKLAMFVLAAAMTTFACGSEEHDQSAMADMPADEHAGHTPEEHAQMLAAEQAEEASDEHAGHTPEEHAQMLAAQQAQDATDEGAQHTPEEHAQMLAAEQEEESSMEGMSAAEHAMHMGGGGGTTDSTGAAVRNPVHLNADQERSLGIVYTTVGRSTLSRSIRTVGLIRAPEPNVADVTPKVDGFVEELFVATTGESVRAGQPLLSLYSPSLVAAQEELLTARRLLDRIDSTAENAWENANAMLEAARRRLTYWDITPEQIDQIESTGTVTKTMTLVAPRSGIVLDKAVLEGQRVMAGMLLYRIADLTELWIEGELFEQDLQHVNVGSMAHMGVAAYPELHVMGRVNFVYPTVDPATRTNKVRVSVANRDLRLKPGMFATIHFDAVVGEDIIAVPTEAILATGERNLVFVRLADGMLYNREVTLGARAGDNIHVISGLSEGEVIVASANFLVDAESRLASAGAMAGMDHGEPPETPQPASEHQHD